MRSSFVAVILTSVLFSGCIRISSAEPDLARPPSVPVLPAESANAFPSNTLIPSYRAEKAEKRVQFTFVIPLRDDMLAARGVTLRVRIEGENERPYDFRLQPITVAVSGEAGLYRETLPGKRGAFGDGFNFVALEKDLGEAVAFVGVNGTLALADLERWARTGAVLELFWAPLIAGEASACKQTIPARDILAYYRERAQ